MGMTDPREELGPLLLRGALQETIWGGRHLATLANKALPPDKMIGESWETSVDSVVTVGPHAGSTLGELTGRYGGALIGRRAIEVFGERFPLLAKFMDAQDRLSVQVHPDDEYAAEHEGGKLGKTETWHVLHADPGAQLVFGLARPCREAEVREAIESTRLEQLLNVVEARPGDTLLVPAGTVHAIGSGIILYELQEYSDLTYRLYDYGRRQADGSLRELHVDKGLAVMRYVPSWPPRTTPVDGGSIGNGGRRRILAACRYFVMEELLFSGAVVEELDGSSCHIATVLDGYAEVRAHGQIVRLETGDTLVVPASIGTYTIYGSRARLLRSYVPRADEASLELWRAAQASINRA